MNSWLLICLLATQGLDLYAEVCPLPSPSRNCTVMLKINQLLPTTMMSSQPPSLCSETCMILDCNTCWPDGPVNKVTVKYSRHMNRTLCYTNGSFVQFQNYCCEIKGGNNQNPPETSCNLVKKQMQDDMNSDEGTSLTVVGGPIGSLIALLLLGILIILIVQTVRKQKRGHALQGIEKGKEGRRYHNMDIENTTFTQREPCPYEYAGRCTQPHAYAQLEGVQLHSSVNHYASQHVYEDADKYFREDSECEEKAHPGVNGERPEFQCVITPPPEDDYTNPDDAITKEGVAAKHCQTNIEETRTPVSECQQQLTTEAEQHNYAVLEPEGSMVCDCEEKHEKEKMSVMTHNLPFSSATTPDPKMNCSSTTGSHAPNSTQNMDREFPRDN